MKFDDSLGVLFGLVSWGVMFGIGLCVVPSSNPPIPRHLEAGQHDQGYGEHHKSNPQTIERGAENHPVFIRIEKTDEDKKSAEEDEKRAKENAKTQFLQTVFNGGLLVVTIFMFLVAGAQMWIMAGQRYAQRAELRPYVSIGANINQDHDPVADTDYHLAFNCTNHGKTPAISIGFRGNIWMVERPFDDNAVPPIPSGFKDDRTSLFPGEALHDRNLGFTPSTEKKFSAQQIKRFTDGVSAYVVGINIRYRDNFKKHGWHETQEYWVIHYDSGKRFVRQIPGKAKIT